MTKGPVDDIRAELYRSYPDWKGWDGAEEARSSEVYRLELVRAGMSASADILEIGYGQGVFLDFCRDAGHRVVGIEIIPELVERARARGHTVHLADTGSEIPVHLGPFDLVAAFDVFEHLTVPELLALLRASRNVLRSSGKIIARFPNGGSPFSAMHQHGDLTHRTCLSASAIEQVARQAGLQLHAAYNAARPLNAGQRTRFSKRMAYLVRDLVEAALGLVYYGRRVPLDPNMTVVLEPLSTTVPPRRATESS